MKALEVKIMFEWLKWIECREFEEFEGEQRNLKKKNEIIAHEMSGKMSNEQKFTGRATHTHISIKLATTYELIVLTQKLLNV